MKILLVTDSHGRLDYLMEMWEAEQPDIVFSTGDYTKDVEELSYVYPKSKYYIVRGNCDFQDYENGDREVVELEGNKFFLTHGHLYGVKRSYSHLRLEGMEKGMDFCIFGHTHIPYIEREGNLTLFNPGAAQDRLYGVVEITDGKVEIKHKKLR